MPLIQICYLVFGRSMLSKSGRYEIQYQSGRWHEIDVINESCTCLDWQQRTLEDGCKHMRRVDHKIKRGRVPRPDSRLPSEQRWRPDYSTGLAVSPSWRTRSNSARYLILFRTSSISIPRLAANSSTVNGLPSAWRTSSLRYYWFISSWIRSLLV